MNNLVDGKLYFTNCQPSAYCSLGEITWELTQEQSVCHNCGPIPLVNVKLTNMFYDGFHWENPSCPNCDGILKALPVAIDEREIIIANRKKMSDVLNVGAVKG